jgi:hypothetical protein
MSDLEYLLGRLKADYRLFGEKPITNCYLIDMIKTTIDFKQWREEDHERFLNSLSEVTDPNS